MHEMMESESNKKPATPPADLPAAEQPPVDTPATAETVDTPATAEAIDVIGEPPAPNQPAETDFNIVDLPPAPEPNPIPQKQPGQENWTMDDWRKVDWRKKVSQIAREMGVSRQRVGQIKKDLQARGGLNYGSGPMPPEDVPTFEDISGNGEGELPPQPSPEALLQNKLAQYRQSAEIAFDVSVNVLSTIFGPEWQPQPPQQMANGQVFNEREGMVQCIDRYLQTQNIPDIPPGWMLVAVTAIYAGRRLNAPTTKDKLGRAWQWARGKAAGLFKMFKKKP